ncbi:MAG: Eco57I restriction-modification methylase domain-containing protein [Thermoleophilaceae bacterium]
MTDALRSRLRDVLDRLRRPLQRAERRTKRRRIPQPGAPAARTRSSSPSRCSPTSWSGCSAFPTDAYFPQLGRSGLKPDFTPHDLVAHRFVLDAKSSTQDLGAHEAADPPLHRPAPARLRRAVQPARDPRLPARRDGPRRRALRRRACSRSGRRLTGEAMRRTRSRAASSRLRRSASPTGRSGLAEKIERIRQARAWTRARGAGRDASRSTSTSWSTGCATSRARCRRTPPTSVDDPRADARRFNPARERALLGELELLALDLAPGTDLDDAARARWRATATAGDLAGRVWRQYLLRVSQLALTRILLYRSWEDVEFVDELPLRRRLRAVVRPARPKTSSEVLREAFAARPRALPLALRRRTTTTTGTGRATRRSSTCSTRCVPVPLGKLDADVLGGLYESYVDEIDRDRLGQFYTPRPVVRFMLDRAGFDGAEGVFRIEGDRREPAAAARLRHRLRAASSSRPRAGWSTRRGSTDDERDLDDGLDAIVRGFHGCEISPFPYYLTEVNLLLQVSRLLGGHARSRAPKPSAFVARRGPRRHARRTRRPRIGASTASTPRAAPIAASSSATSASASCRSTARSARRSSGCARTSAFDLVVGNPPYVFETNNKVALRPPAGATRPGGSDYRGKSDYLYYFLLLAAEKVAPGGRLCVITPAGWMNAGNADWLRERLAGDAPARTSCSCSAPTGCSRPSGRRARDRAPGAARRRWRARSSWPRKAPVPRGPRAADRGAGGRGGRGGRARRATAARPDRDRAAGADGRADGGPRPVAGAGSTCTGVRQRDSGPRRSRGRSSTARATSRRRWSLTSTGLADEAVPVEPLAQRGTSSRASQTGADAYTARDPEAPRRPTSKRAARRGRSGAPAIRSWSFRPAASDERAVERSPGAAGPQPRAARDPLRRASTRRDYTSLVWIGRDDAVPAVGRRGPRAVATRARDARGVRAQPAGGAGSRPPGRATRPSCRAPEGHRPLPDRPRPLRGRRDRRLAALDQDHALHPREEGLSVAYLGGLLNSELLDLWYAVRGKIPGTSGATTSPSRWRGCPTATSSGSPTCGVGPTGPASTTRWAPATPPAPRRLPASWQLRARRASWQGRWSCSSGRSQTTAGGCSLCATCSPSLLGRVKDPWRARIPPLSEPGGIRALLARDTASVRIDPELNLRIDTDGPLGRGAMAEHGLVFTRARRTTAEVGRTGAPAGAAHEAPGGPASA